ncbi:MAG: hypothetical protein ACE5R4_03630 [Armatimonadota bacterium]
MPRPTVDDTTKQLMSGIATALTQLESLRELLAVLNSGVRKRLSADANMEEEEDVADEVISSLEEAESMLEEAETCLEEARDFVEHGLDALVAGGEGDD